MQSQDWKTCSLTVLRTSDRKLWGCLSLLQTMVMLPLNLQHCPYWQVYTASWPPWADTWHQQNLRQTSQQWWRDQAGSFGDIGIYYKWMWGHLSFCHFHANMRTGLCKWILDTNPVSSLKSMVVDSDSIIQCGALRVLRLAADHGELVFLRHHLYSFVVRWSKKANIWCRHGFVIA